MYILAIDIFSYDCLDSRTKIRRSVHTIIMEADQAEQLATDTKFLRFSASVERALRAFEVTREWHDLISALARLHKVPVKCEETIP